VARDMIGHGLSVTLRQVPVKFDRGEVRLVTCFFLSYSTPLVYNFFVIVFYIKLKPRQNLWTAVHYRTTP
jgi:hypothetical protein